MEEITNTKRYDLEERTLIFAKECREFVQKLNKTIANCEDGKQLIRSSGSQAANYIEANESIRTHCKTPLGEKQERLSARNKNS